MCAVVNKMPVISMRVCSVCEEDLDSLFEQLVDLY